MHRRASTSALSLFLGAALTFVPAVSSADGAVAARDFDEGLRAMLAGDFDAGCPRLLASYQADPRGGVLFTLAECYAKSGHGAEALQRYTEYLSLYSRLSVEQRAAQKERAKIAEAQCDALSRALKVEETGRKEAALAASASAPASASPEPPPQKATTVPGRAGPAFGGWALGATLATGLFAAASGITAAMAMDQKAVADRGCSPAGVCTNDGAAHAGNTARTLANVTTGLLIVAGVGAVGSVTFWSLRAGERSRVELQLVPSALGIGLRGAF